MGVAQSIVEMLAFQPPATPKQEPVLPEDADKIVLTTGRNSVPIYIFRGKARHRSPHNQQWIILSHGSSEDCTKLFTMANRLATTLSVVVVMYEYPGYGMSTSATAGGQRDPPSEAGTFDAARVAYTHVRTECRVPPERIIVMGWSIGTGPTLELATTQHVAGAIIQSAPRSAIRVKCCTPWSLSFDIIRNEDKVSKLDKEVHVLVIHGDRDEVVPIQHGQKLHELLAARGNAHGDGFWLPGRGHMDVVRDAAYIPTIQQFLEDMRDVALGLNPVDTLKPTGRVAPSAVTMGKDE